MTIVGPLFWKELIESSRRIRYYAVRSLVAGVVLTTLISLGQPLAKHQISQLAGIGRQLLEQWAWVQLSALVLFVPAFASGLIAGEKDKKTIDALFTTCLTDREILWGKLASRLFATVVIIASSLPVIVLLSFLGGFGPREVIDYALVQLATAVLCAAVGLYYSVVSTKPYVALIRAYFVLLVTWLLIPMLATPIHSLLPRWGAMGGARMFATDLGPAALMCINPFVWMIYQNRAAFPGAVRWSPPAYVFVVLALFVSYLLLRRSHLILREAAYWQRVPRLWRWTTRCYDWLIRSAGRAVERRSQRGFWRKLWDWELKSRLWGSWERRYGLNVNPLFYRRATANVYDPERYIAGLQILGWVVVLSLVFLGGYVWHDLLGDAENFVAFLGLELPLLALVIAILASSSIAREADRGSLDILLLTSLTAREIFAGTIWGVIRTAWPVFGLVLLTMLVGSLATLHEEALIVWALTLVPMIACLMAGCMLITVVARRTMTAVTASLAAPIFFVGVPYVLDTLQTLRGPEVLYVVLGIVIVLIALRVMGRRNSVFMAMLLAISIPLLCMLVGFYISGGWSSGYQPSGYYSARQFYYSSEPSGPWMEINYARWLLGPLYQRYSMAYVSNPSVSALQFGFAQTVAAIWLFSMTLKNLDFMLGRSNWNLGRAISESLAAGPGGKGRAAVLAPGLPLADRRRARSSAD
jgi:ABC-type transport system involved in multi-copper enzyme maturation permease subunit